MSNPIHCGKEMEIVRMSQKKSLLEQAKEHAGIHYWLRSTKGNPVLALIGVGLVAGKELFEYFSEPKVYKCRNCKATKNIA